MTELPSKVLAIIFSHLDYERNSYIRHAYPQFDQEWRDAMPQYGFQIWTPTGWQYETFCGHLINAFRKRSKRQLLTFDIPMNDSD